MNEFKVDVLVDVQFGDCGKGKVSKILNETNSYGIIAKYNGGGNAGHAVWLKDKKYTAHYLTSGIYNADTTIIIGPGCVLNPKEFLDEINKFEEAGFNVKSRTFIHPFCNIIEDKHIQLDDPDNKIGSTKKGIGPCYSDKYARKNKRAESIKELHDYIISSPEYILQSTTDILMEGSQGWYLDIDWGNYPYVTSSHIHPAFAFATFGIPMSRLGKVYGVAKIYETYVGSNEYMVYSRRSDGDTIREAGHEYGETTGRPRKVGYLNINRLIRALNHTGVTELFINKCDILKEVGIYKLFDRQETYTEFNNLEDMVDYINTVLKEETSVNEILYGFSKE